MCLDKCQFDEILAKRECSEFEYNNYKEQFDAAVKAGLITSPVPYETPQISDGSGTHIGKTYMWKMKEFARDI